MDKVDHALDSAWPDRKGSAFTNEMSNALGMMIDDAKRRRN